MIFDRLPEYTKLNKTQVITGPEIVKDNKMKNGFKTITLVVCWNIIIKQKVMFHEDCVFFSFFRVTRPFEEDYNNSSK